MFVARILELRKSVLRRRESCENAVDAPRARHEHEAKAYCNRLLHAVIMLRECREDAVGTP